MRRRARVDANQASFVKVMRQLGYSVCHLHQLGQGVPDLLIGKGGRNYLFELKDGNKPPSKRKLTEDEERWHAQWQGQVATVKSVDEALAILNG